MKLAHPSHNQPSAAVCLLFQEEVVCTTRLAVTGSPARRPSLPALLLNHFFFSQAIKPLWVKCETAHTVCIFYRILALVAFSCQSVVKHSLTVCLR